MIIAGGLEIGGVGTLISILLLIESLIAFGFFLWIGQRIFLGEPSPATAQVSSSTPIMGMVLIILSILCVVVPIFVFPLIQHIPLGM